MGAMLLRFCPISAGHGAGILVSATGVPAVPVSSERLAVEAMECGDCPSILDVAHSPVQHATLNKRGATRAPPITCLAERSPCRA